MNLCSFSHRHHSFTGKKKCELVPYSKAFSCSVEGMVLFTLFGVNSRTWLLWMIGERLVTWKEVPWFSGFFFSWQESAWSESQRTLFRKVSSWCRMGMNYSLGFTTAVLKVGMKLQMILLLSVCAAMLHAVKWLGIFFFIWILSWELS